MGRGPVKSRVGSWEDVEAAFWDRQPEEIHADLLADPEQLRAGASRTFTEVGLRALALTPEEAQVLEAKVSRGEATAEERWQWDVLLGCRIYQALAAAQREVATWPEDAQRAAKLMPFGLVTRWRRASPERREQLEDLAAAQWFRQRHGDIVGTAVAVHQRHLYQLMADQTRPLVERKAARERLRRILFAQSLRGRQRRAVDPVGVAIEEERAQRRLRPLRRTRWRNPAALKLALREELPEFPASVHRALADAIVQRDRERVRAAILNGIGSVFGRKAGTLRLVLAEGRRRLEAARRANRGYEGYRRWLAEQRLEPPSNCPRERPFPNIPS